MYSKFINYLPSDHLIGKFSLFMSIMALFFAVSLSGDGMGCLNAEECNVGDSESFSNNIRVYTNGTHYHEITGDTNNQNTQDHVLKLPNVTGTLLASSMSFGNDQYIKTNAQGEIISDDLPALDIDDDSKIDVSGITSGKFLQTTGTGLNFVDVDINETTFDASSGSEGQILQISGGSLTFQDMSGGGGSFQATANQNLVAGSVGIESDGSISNITTLQDGVSQLTLSETSTGNSQTNITWMSSHYNSNVDAQIFAYRDYDANNQNTCSTHYYVDVVEQDATGELSNWGRQCISDEWDMHLTNYGYSQFNNSSYPQGYDHCYKFTRYGLEEDYSVNNYVFVYAGCSGNNSNSSDGQIWGIPIQINPSNNTLIVGTESLIHDQHVCNNNDACNNTNQAYYPSTIHSNVYAQQTSDANRMWIFYRAYRGGYYSNSYVWYKSYTCNFTQSTGDTCTPNQAYASDMYQGNGSNSLIQNWYDTFSPAIWWDDNAQAFLLVNRTTMSSSQCRFAQMRLAENYNSANTSFSQTLNYAMGYTGVTDDINGGTFDISGSSISCGRQNQRPIFDVENNQFIWLLSSGGSNDIDMVLYHLKGDVNSYTGTPIEVGLGSLQGLITDEECANVFDRYCSSHVQNLEGHVYIDNTVSPYKFYWHNEGLMDRNICTKDYQSSKCAEIYTWSMNNTTGFIDNTTFTHFDYQNEFESYHNDPDSSFGVWIDQGTDTLFTFNAHSNQATDPVNNNKLHAIAFVIPDNISEWIGYVNQSYNQGATVTVYSVGAVIDGLSGLTIGAEYFVQADGSIGTNGTYKIGRAIATDKIYVTSAR